MTNEDRKMMHEIHTAVMLAAEKVDRHDKTLYGNGQPGVCTRLKELEVTSRLNSKWVLGILSGTTALIGGGVGVFCKELISKLVN